MQRSLPQREIGLARPLARPHGLVVEADVMAHLQQQREHELSDRARAVNRHVRHRNATLRAAAISTQSNPVAVSVMNLKLGRLVDQRQPEWGPCS